MKHKFNINVISFDWIITYLSERQQKIKINQHLSNLFPLKCGVPQGCCLGPVVFIAFISFLFEFIDDCDPAFGAFADDHQIHLSSAPSNNEIQININMQWKSASKK